MDRLTIDAAVEAFFARWPDYPPEEVVETYRDPIENVVKQVEERVRERLLRHLAERLPNPSAFPSDRDQAVREIHAFFDSLDQEPEQ